MEQWEYKSVVFDFNTGLFATGKVDRHLLDNGLNHHGREGWELVNMFDTNGGHGATRFVIGVFKRKVLQAESVDA